VSEIKFNSIFWLNYNRLFHCSQANAASSAEEDGEDMDDDDAEEQKPTVLKVKLFNK
jgi:hypothetical protein